MKVLIVGFGSIAKKHLAALRLLRPDAEVLALRSGHSANSAEGVTNIYSLAEIGTPVDFAIISNPTSLHAATIECLLELKIPLFIEKPLFDTLNHKWLLGEIDRRGIPTYVACNLRFLDSLQFLHRYINGEGSERRINEVNVYCGSYLPEWRPGTNYKKCYSAIPELGGGVNIDLIHEIDYTQWIFGNPIASRGVCRSVSGLGIRAVDYANYTLLYPSFTASIVLNYYRRDYRRGIEILFDDDTWTLDVKHNEIRNMHGETVYKGENTVLDTYPLQMKHFIDGIENGATFENDVHQAYKTLETCLDYERFD